ncbi:NADPH-dependent FMN reductase [Stenoxybacter acetivorans]|uniref:NADPH-dependent FMN reductase n=1 Tax=Stenoxybacter acetivorans TaxID=422441 RepID=UPI000562804A|nr:NADPH-dependent FMN reductase [Stenoxybacter acetivorans]
MPNLRQIALIVGSLRQDAYSKKIAAFLRANAPANWQITEIEINDLPLYNQDYDDDPIESYERVRGQLSVVDAVLFISPEHNRSIPAALKNVIDIASRPAGKSVWTGKKTAVITSSPGTFGGLSAGLHLRQVLQLLSAQVLVAPEVYLSRITDSLDEQGNLSDERTQTFLRRFIQTFDDWLA